MSNIWEFLLQTANVSLAAAVLLLVKYILRDKLSPRWQYGVWLVLALTALIPASATRSLLPQLGLWLETLKFNAELPLASAYADAFDPLNISCVVPLPAGLPASWTDWLFVLHTLGVLATLLLAAGQYVRLRVLLRRGDAAGEETDARIAAVAEKYGLKGCRAVRVPGLETAFVCGFFRPVLALPGEGEPDEKIILHELLHLKYRDAAQGVFWLCLRALHWCNPFMQYVINRVGGDMESLCDGRVLERLSGEERREYGGILLTMASRRYAGVPGTSSISNGGRNISRRIEAIARFKLYPRDMALVSVCITLILASALPFGVSAQFNLADLRDGETDSLASDFAVSRLERCTTAAGALDTFAAGLQYGSRSWLAMATSMELQEYWYESALEAGEDNGYSSHFVSVPLQLGIGDKPVVISAREGEDGYLNSTLAFHGYVRDPEGFIQATLKPAVISARENAGGSLSATLAFRGFRWNPEGSETVVEGDNYWMLPVTVEREGGFYVVSETGTGYWLNRHELASLDGLPPAYVQSVETELGTLTAALVSRCHTLPPSETGFRIWNEDISSDGVPLPDAVWNVYGDAGFCLTLDVSGLIEESGNPGPIVVRYCWMDDASGAEEFFAANAGSVGELEDMVNGPETYGDILWRSEEISAVGGVLPGWEYTDWAYDTGPNSAPDYPGAVAVILYAGPDYEPVDRCVLEMEAAE